MKISELKRFNAVDYLDNHEDIELFLEAAITGGGGVEHIKQAFVIAEQARLKLDEQMSLNDLIASAVAKAFVGHQAVIA